MVAGVLEGGLDKGYNSCPHGLQSNLQMNRFHYSLPSNVVKRGPAKDDNKGHKKRQRQESRKVANNNQETKWKLRQNERWETVFREKSRGGPRLSMGCAPCLKFHCKGWCFEDCAFKKSHKRLNAQDKERTDAYDKSLRGE